MNDLKPLQKKAELSFDHFFKKYKEEMACAKGCSRCCIAGLSVFAWEAAIISDWFHCLSEEEKQDWKKKQKLPSSQKRPFINSDARQDTPCAFLREDACTIYEVRPTLCRTQGMALRFKERSQKGDTEYRDWCPLNFTNDLSPAPEDDLNLDQLNAMLSRAQLLYEKENPEAMSPLRIELSDLRDYLL